MDLAKQFSGQSEELLVELLDELVEKYIPESLQELGLNDVFKHISDLFDNESFIYSSLLEVICLHHSFVVDGLLTSESDGEKSNKYLTKFNKLFEVFYCAKYGLRAFDNIRKRTDTTYDSEVNVNLGLSRFEPIDPDNLKPFQSLLRYLLISLSEDQYRRQHDYCMKRVIKDGYDTHAWEMVMTIADYVYFKCQYGINQHQWLNITDSPGNAKNSITYLEKSKDGIYFPDIVKDRKLFSYRNGIYETSYLDETDTYVDRWFPHTRERREEFPHISKDLCPHRTAVKYFDVDFPFEEYNNVPWYDIPTPHFQSILSHQQFPDEVCKWMYILCGRVLHEVGDLDEWQCMPFLLGKAQTGKSTICTKVVKIFYDPIDVGVLSNNVEPTFGLSAISNKMAFIGPEINENLRLDQTEFQSLISGEDVQVATKHKTAKPKKWTVPGIIAGNNPPGYRDNQGSVSRRLIIFGFNKRVKKGDTNLGKKLEREIANLLLKCNRAYLEAVHKYEGIDIWTVLPEYFHITKQSMSKQTNALVHFLNSSKVMYNDDRYCNLEKFSAVFKEYCADNSFRRPKWINTYYDGPFEDMGVTLMRGKRFDRYDNRSKTADWIMGLDLVVAEDGKIGKEDNDEE